MPDPNSPASPVPAAEAGARSLTWCAAALLLAVFFAYAPSLTAGFTSWDDRVYVVDNPLIKDFSPRGLARLLTAVHEQNYHPLALLSYALEHRLFGLDPFWYHLDNLLLHLLNTALLLVLLRALTRRPALACVAAGLWGLHPFHVESVAWVAERRDVLFTALTLAALIAYARARGSGRPARYGAALGLFALACTAKAMAVTVPLALVVLEASLEGRLRVRQALRRTLPFFAVAAVFLAVTARIRAGSGDLSVAKVLDVGHNGLVASYALLFYLRKTLLPAGLSAIYPYPAGHGLALPWPYLVAPAALAAVAALSWSLRRRLPELLPGALFFGVTLLPVIHLVPTGFGVAADRYSYLPTMGLAFVAGALVDRAALAARGRPPRRAALGAAVGAIALALGALTWQRTLVWRGDLALWDDALRQYPASALALAKRGDARLALGDPEGALRDLEAALEIDPSLPTARGNRAVALWRLGRTREALEDFSAEIRLAPGDPQALVNRGVALTEEGRPGEALADLDAAVRLDAAHPGARFARARALAALGRRPEALAELEAGLALAPGDAAALALRAQLAAGAP